MTTSVWNKNEIEKQFQTCATLKDLIGFIETDFSARGEVVCEIRINGILIDENDEAKFANQATSEIRDLSVRSTKPAVLIVDALNSTIAFIPQLETRALATAEHFRAADLVRGQVAFAEITEGCQWMVETLLHVKGAAAGLQITLENLDLWQSSEKRFFDVTQDLLKARSTKDWILLADILEYELTTLLQSWTVLIRGHISKSTT
jgi:hypothetical protein